MWLVKQNPAMQLDNVDVNSNTGHSLAYGL